MALTPDQKDDTRKQAATPGQLTLNDPLPPLDIPRKIPRRRRRKIKPDKKPPAPEPEPKPEPETAEAPPVVSGPTNTTSDTTAETSPEPAAQAHAQSEPPAPTVEQPAEPLQPQLEEIAKVAENIFLTEEEQKLYDNFLYTVKYEKYKELGFDAISYIIRQINNESLMSVIDESQFSELIQKSLSGLFKTVYIKHWDSDLVAKDALFASSRIFLVLMFLRIFKGRNYMYKLETEMAKSRPIVAGVGGH